MYTEWVRMNVVITETGYSEHSIRAKIKNGKWLMGEHWNKAPDGRLVFNLKKIWAWMGQAWKGS